MTLYSGSRSRWLTVFIPLFCLLFIIHFITSPAITVTAAEEIKYRFDEHLCDAYWAATFPGHSWEILPCPGESIDSRGFVQMISDDLKLEDNSFAERTFETHPIWQTDGLILGTFSISRMGITLQEGDQIMGDVGFLEGALAGRVKFTISYDQDPIEPGGEVTLFETEDTYDGQLKAVDIDLSPYAGQSGDILLKVSALGVPDQDWAVWKNLRVTRQTPATPTFTRTYTPSMTTTFTSRPSATMTASVTPMRPTTITPTTTMTSTPTPVDLPSPPPPVIVPDYKKPCACYESSVIETYFSGNDGFAVGNLIRGKGLMLLTVVDEKASGDNGLFTVMDPDGVVVNTFEARFTPNDVVAIGDVWGDDLEEEILVGIDEDKKVYIYNSSGQLLEIKNIPFTRFDILAVGNIREGFDSPGDEIILASDEKDEFTIYPRLGDSYSIGLDWNFDGSSVPGIKNDSHSDALTTGNVFGSALDEILFIDQNGDFSILYMYNDQGTLLAKTRVMFTKFDAFASGDVLGNDYDEVIIGIDEDRAIFILDALNGILKMHYGRVTPVDVIAAGEVTAGNKETIFLAVDDDSKIYIYKQE